ncbi:P1 family peptidase [Granulosicoccus antarcticus]|uniref:Putative aminopeptidase n=1 Tax=Granulosicoccus antarcticus IMCC3135 TaxID=1192854 RepID=A0A2Z2NYC0_9GAMM|nr:P1 family peptidase [Granulosicoccus antarcticus]ASJ76432.1 putative aminopeptidase [Granulosicoccus antarcticus IMCC3135]
MNEPNELRWSVGPRNLITDIPGLRVGNASDAQIKSGVTVLTSEQPFIASVDIMGGAPGTRETDCLAPDKLVEEVDALVLSGGSALGLDAASGVVAALRESGRGFNVGPVRVPIVPAAIIFDLLNGGQSDWLYNPYQALGRQALAAAGEGFALGSAGAGVGATTAVLKGGLGSASIVMPDGTLVGALVVVNPHGSVVTPGGKAFWAAPFEMHGEFGGCGQPMAPDPFLIPRNDKLRAYEAMRGLPGGSSGSPPAGMNTTIAIVATNAVMNKAQLLRMAVAAQDGMARAIVPSHTPFDGDLVFALSTCGVPMQAPVEDAMRLGHAAAVCLSRAIARAVYLAESAPGDTLPSWQDKFGHDNYERSW